jgi:hypothetical protein
VERGVRLMRTYAGLAIAYGRVATEPRYGAVERAFLQLPGRTFRRRAVMK